MMIDNDSFAEYSARTRSSKNYQVESANWSMPGEERARGTCQIRAVARLGIPAPV
jgi:hypothetical protein